MRCKKRFSLSGGFASMPLMLRALISHERIDRVCSGWTINGGPLWGSKILMRKTYEKILILAEESLCRAPRA
jgi:hypothetical protein